MISLSRSPRLLWKVTISFNEIETAQVSSLLDVFQNTFDFPSSIIISFKNR